MRDRLLNRVNARYGFWKSRPFYILENEMKDIIVEFAGWVQLSPANVKFVKMGEQDERPDVITGVEWQKLDEDDQGDYVLEDVIDAQRDCDDGSYDQINVFTGPQLH